MLPVLVQDIETMVNTNVLAASLLVRLFCKGMLERNRGHIINISSIAAKQRYPGEVKLNLHGATSKARCSSADHAKARSAKLNRIPGLPFAYEWYVISASAISSRVHILRFAALLTQAPRAFRH